MSFPTDQSGISLISFSFLAFTVRFDHPSIDSRSTVNMVFVDTKTISFYSPPCPIILTQDNPSCTIPIVVTQNNNELARIDFMYQSSMFHLMNFNRLYLYSSVFLRSSGLLSQLS